MIAAISKRMQDAASHEEMQQVKQARRDELDTFKSVDQVIEAAAAETLKITEKFKEASEENNAKLVAITQQMAQ